CATSPSGCTGQGGSIYTNAATAQIAPTMSAAPATSSSAPDSTIRGSAMRPVAQAIALGPVPAGSMKPQLAAIAAGSASRSGSAPSATVRLATTGMMPLAVATLLANSVIRITSATTATATIHSGSAESGNSDWPSQAARPEAVIPAA